MNRQSDDDKHSREYRFPYAWRAVERAVLMKIAAPDRKALETLVATPPAG